MWAFWKGNLAAMVMATWIGLYYTQMRERERERERERDCTALERVVGVPTKMEKKCVYYIIWLAHQFLFNVKIWETFLSFVHLVAF